MIKGWTHLKFWKHHWPQVLSNIQAYNGVTLPDRKHLFKALQLTPFKEVRCVILAQDPYPTKGHANGLAFSVFPHVSPLPKTLDNILSEYRNDLGFSRPKTGSLEPWANNGVLLLNTILTVEEGKKLSHAGLGWEKLTYEIVRDLAERDDCVFVLWGKKAQEYSGGLRRNKTIVSAHPSPLSAQKGFFGSKPFSRVNEYLRGMDKEPINWRLV